MAFALILVGVVSVAAYFGDPLEPAAAVKSTAKPAMKPLARSDPGVDPWVEKNIPAPEPEPQKKEESQPEAQPETVVERRIASRPEVEPEAKPESKPKVAPEPKSETRSEPETRPKPSPAPKTEPAPESDPLPAGESAWTKPTDEELEAASEPRRYELPSGAIMGLTVRAIGIYNAPVFDSTSRWALTNGVAHEPETSLPWSRTPERNVYLAGHRMGYSGTWSRMIFYHLDKLDRGDEVLLRDREGGKYEYRVIESFEADVKDTWVMGRIRDRDLLTLQTCTPIPAFDKRLIVRAERV